MSEAREDDAPMTLGEHLEELRWRVLKALGWVVLTSSVCLYFQDRIMDLAMWPYRHMQKTTEEDLRTAEAVKFLEARLVKLAEKGAAEDDALALATDELARARAIAREKANPSLGELGRLRERQDDLHARVNELRARWLAVADQKDVDTKALVELDRQHAALVAEAKVLHDESERLARPLIDVHAKAPSQTVRSQGPSDTFMAYLKLAFVAGLFLASPLVVREIWGFVATGLYSHEKRYINLFAPLSFAAFVVGFLFGYLIMIPLGLKFLATYGATTIITVEYTIDGYLSTFMGLSLVSGAIFELPLIMTFLAAIGFMSPAKFREFRRYWVLVAFIIAAILTPPDGVTQFLMAIPLLGLYELGIVLSAMVHREEAPPPAELPVPTPAPAVPTLRGQEPPDGALPGELPLQDDPEPPRTVESQALETRPPPEGTVAAGALADADPDPSEATTAPTPTRDDPAP